MFSTAGLARISARRPWFVVVAWMVVVVAAAVVAAFGLGDAFTSETVFTNRPESTRGADLLTERLYRGADQPVLETVIIRSETLTVDDLAYRQVVERVAAELRGLPTVVTAVATSYEAVAAGMADGAGLVSDDRRSTLLIVTLAGDVDEASQHVEEYLGAIDRVQTDGFQIVTVGDVTVDDAFNRLAEEDLIKGEGLGLIAALIILVVVFGALIAAGVPIILAFVAIVVALGLTALIGAVMDLSFFITNMITMIGLAVGIDYTLFVVSRYREERRRGWSKHAAIEIAGGSASNAVLFSGATVVLALLGMFLIPTVVFRSLGAGAILVVIVAVAATLTLVPALLSLLGDQIDWPRRTTGVARRETEAPGNPAGFWGGIARVVMARPVVSVAVAGAVLIAAALPYVDLARGRAGVESLPAGRVRTAYELLARDFPSGRLAPVEVVVDGPRTAAVAAAIDNLAFSLSASPLFGPADPVEWNAADDLALLRIPLTVEMSSPGALAAVNVLRDELIPAAFSAAPAEVFVTGGPAENADFEAVLSDYTPIVFAFVLGLSFLLLMVAFRSIVVPLKAIVMNLLSVGAAYGLMVLVFQKGYGHALLGFNKTPMIENWIPIFLFCVLFGLSMDYHVFLLSRIKEHYDQTRDNRESVAVGLHATAKIITGAAMIMVAVFAGFASGQLVMFQQVGFGLAVAIILDATIVRTVLVPASMVLLGDRNWYLPRWLGWLPAIQIEGAPAALPSTVTPHSAD